jgi:long-chain acyl-CoA synthetase
VIELLLMRKRGHAANFGHREERHQPHVWKQREKLPLQLDRERFSGHDDAPERSAARGSELLVRVGQPGRYSVMRGYYNRPEETAKAIKDGWIHTGDVAKADADGYLYIVDRKKDMVLSGGFNIYTKEVEQALLQNPEIADAAVVGVPDAVFGEAVAAFIEREPGSAPTAASVVEHVRNLVAGYKKPKYVFIVDALPRNSLGKVLKRELRDQASDLVENARRFETSG